MREEGRSAQWTPFVLDKDGILQGKPYFPEVKMEFYPVTMYNWDGRFIVCSSKAHKEALGAGWFASAVEATRAHDEAQKELTTAVQQIAGEQARPRRREN